MEIITKEIRSVIASIQGSDKEFWLKKLKDQFDLAVQTSENTDYWIIRELYKIFEPISPELIKACGVKTVILRDDMGPNKAYFPNHGYFINHEVTLNSDIFYHPDSPDDFFDYHGYFVTRPQQTVIHEFGHGFDFHHNDLSTQPAWLKLSGWSEAPQPGLERLKVKEEGAPELIGEWYFDPKAEFTRFYAKRNPWDDWADSFSFYVAGLRNKVPPKKAGYFSEILKGY
jgi:hypothetical protein